MAAHSDASVDNAVKVIDANLVCASIKLRIEHVILLHVGKEHSSTREALRGLKLALEGRN